VLNHIEVALAAIELRVLVHFAPFRVHHVGRLGKAFTGLRTVDLFVTFGG